MFFNKLSTPFFGVSVNFTFGNGRGAKVITLGYNNDFHTIASTLLYVLLILSVLFSVLFAGVGTASAQSDNLGCGRVYFETHNATGATITTSHDDNDPAKQWFDIIDEALELSVTLEPGYKFEAYVVEFWGDAEQTEFIYTPEAEIYIGQTVDTENCYITITAEASQADLSESVFLPLAPHMSTGPAAQPQTHAVYLPVAAR